MFDSMSLSELFAAAEEIGAKYQTAEERAAFARELSQSAKEIAAQTSKKAWEVATSDRAIQFYRQIVVVSLLVILFLGAAIYYTAQAIFTFWLRPGAIALYRKAKRQAPIAQAILSRWINAAYAKVAHRLNCEWQNLIAIATNSWQ